MVEEPQRTSNRLDQKSLPHNNQSSKHTIQRKKYYNLYGKKDQVAYKGRPVRITTDLSKESLVARRA
jgi:flagellum-specific peptidoglycan hydrolase FlgJ